MTASLVEVILPSITGVPADAVVNTFAFDSYSVGIATAVEAFYNGANVHHPLAYNLALTLDRSAGKAKLNVYDITGHLDGSPHGVPIEMDTFTLGASSGDAALPADVCVGLSFHADITYTGRKAARQRGRVFLGPMADNASVVNQNATTKEAEVGTAFTDDLLSAAATLLAAEPTWSVWSRADAALHAVIGGWVQNRFDSQRRRRTAATSRRFFT